MALRSHTYAIRLAVEGGGQVKAELVAVGQSGEQGLKRIESAGDRASGGLGFRLIPPLRVRWLRHAHRLAWPSLPGMASARNLPAHRKHRLAQAAFVLPDFRPLVEALIALVDFRPFAEAPPPASLASGTSISRPLFTS